MAKKKGNKDAIVSNLISDIQTSSSNPDAETIASQSIYQAKFNEANLNNFLQNQRARRIYSYRIFIITGCWLASVILILIFQGLKAWGFSISDKVLIALLGTTTVNVLGFFVIVIQYLFNKEKST